MAKPLPLPPAAESDPKSLEMVRVWIADRKLHCVLNIDFWESQGKNELRAWGILLADTMRHIANAHEEQYGRDPDHSLTQIRDAFLNELGQPTSGHLGEFLQHRPGQP